MAEVASSTSFVPAFASCRNVSKPNRWTSGQNDKLPDREKQSSEAPIGFHVHHWRCHQAGALLGRKPDGRVEHSSFHSTSGSGSPMMGTARRCFLVMLRSPSSSASDLPSRDAEAA